MKKYYLIGEKLSHSYSGEIHSFFGLDYKIKELPPDKVGEFLLKKEYGGLNVTVPYKQTVIPFLDELDESAAKIGAVNVIANANGKLKGYNTDYYGLKYALLSAGIVLEGKNVLIAGSGGAAKTAEKLAEDSNAKSVEKVSRTGVTNYGNVYEKTDTQIIINATPVGMYPHPEGEILEPKLFKNLEDVFDCVYNPLKTRLVLKAEKLGIKAEGGLKMLVCQALFSQKIWGERAEFENDTEKVYKYLLGKERNIVLIGMPGAGKTTIGKILAKKLGKEFFDTDELAEKLAGISPEQIILTRGEAEFRRLESEAVSSLEACRGAVIASGGGTILNEENVMSLKSSGALVYVKRDLEKLSSNGRPLSKSGAISRLFEQRKGYYEVFSDFEIENDVSEEEAADKIIREVFA